jgi:hypothetical protein
VQRAPQPIKPVEAPRDTLSLLSLSRHIDPDLTVAFACLLPTTPVPPGRMQRSEVRK